MKRVTPAIFLLMFGISANAQKSLPDFTRDDDLDPRIELMYQNEGRGLTQYNEGNFDSAFGLLSETAVQGLKKSQYILAFMFLKGEHVDKSILLGMGWLGVAKESGEKEWTELYDNMYLRANETQQAMIDEKVNQYIGLYGLDVSNITCRRSQVTGSRRYEIRCIKVGGVNTNPVPVEMHP